MCVDNRFTMVTCKKPDLEQKNKAKMKKYKLTRTQQAKRVQTN